MSETDAASTYDEALKIAGELIDAGVPVFAAAPNPDRPGHYYLPKEWEKTTPDRAQLDKWRPGWALGAVGGHVADFLDFDPRNGGDQSMRELEIQRQMPRAFGVQATPSGGTHLVISPTGERKSTGFMPGVDLQSGNDQGVGRGFVYIAPTVRPSKAPETLGELRAYRWEQPPDMEYLKEFDRGSDDTLEGVVARVHAVRNAVTPRENVTPAAGGSQLFMQGGSGHREFTREQAEAFCTPHLMELQRAQIGEIEEHANRAAAALSHFVPALWSADEAFTVLSVALKQTAYDPAHPASGWDAEKFRAVLDGRRPPLDAWKATKRPETASEVTVTDDAVSALMAEMLTPDELSARPAPQPLIKGLYNLDSVAWLIGAPGSKKSFVVLDQAAHVVRGIPWQGLKVHQGPVVMIVAEGAGGMSTRVKAWQARHGSIGNGLRVLPRPVQAADVAAWEVLVQACGRLEPVMVVIDTQARVTVGLEENSAKDMGVFVEAAERIRQVTGACVIPVHHTGRNGADARGSSAIDGAQGTELKVVRQDALTGTLKVEKQKDLVEREDMPLYFERVVVGVDEDGDDISSLVLLEPGAFRSLAGKQEVPEQWVAASMSVMEMILRALGDHGASRGITKSEAHGVVVERFFGGVKDRLNKSTWHTSWNRALEKGQVINVGGERFTLDSLGGDAPE